MFPKIPKSLLNTLETQQRLFNNPHIQKLQQLTNNFQQFNELRARLESYNLNGIIQQAKLYSLQTQVKFYNPDIQSINFQLQDINLYTKNFEYLNSLINSAVDAYNSTKEKEFEVVVENLSVSIPKTTIKELFSFYIKQGINAEIAIRLAISSFIFIKFYPSIFITNSNELNKLLNYLSKYIYDCGSSVLKLSVQKYYEFQNPEEFAKFLVDQGTSALFGFIIGILK